MSVKDIPTPKKKPKGQLFKAGSGKDPTPVRFTRTKDKLGTTWTTHPSLYSCTTLLEIWVDRKPCEKFFLRQENKGHVDLIQLDLGQAYDVIRALTEALDTND
jgi:hypothetical protein